MAFHEDDIQAALAHLQGCDPIMRSIIDEVGEFTLQVNRDRFAMLVRSIISQQISTAAARSIRRRLEQLAAPKKLTAEVILGFDREQLRSVGLSSQKASYLLDLAEKTSNKTVQLRTIARRSDEEVVAQLTQVKGIGVWTAQMFLIFSLGRLDVFPHDDLGIRSAIRQRYALDDLPKKQQSLEIAAPWRPYATIASWYCWRSLESAQQTDVEDAKGA